MRSPLHTGLDAGRFAPSGGDADLPPDQRAEDALSACFDIAVPPGGPPLEVLGHPVVRLAVRADAPAVRVTVRLCDVAPDGTSLLVARGTATGASGTYGIRCGATGHAFPPGHRIRVAVSSAYWPWVWLLPAPDAAPPPPTATAGTGTGTGTTSTTSTTGTTGTSAPQPAATDTSTDRPGAVTADPCRRAR